VNLAQVIYTPDHPYHALLCVSRTSPSGTACGGLLDPLRRAWETANIGAQGRSEKIFRAGKEVIDMDWKSSSPEQKAKWLSQQMEDIRRSRALLDRFEKVTQKWLSRINEPKKSK
jgi:hypothetical protein